MNAAYTHLIGNHIPVVLFPGALLLLVWAFLTKDDRLKRVTFGILVLIALVTIPVYMTGHEAEELMEEVPGISHDAIEEHEESALPTLIAAEITGAFCLLTLVAYRRSRLLPGWAQGAALFLSAVVVGLVLYTAHHGGHIRHPETLPNWNPPLETEETLAPQDNRSHH